MGIKDLLRRREASRDLAMDKLKEGNVNAASELFQILRSEDIEFVVAPYEADAQLAYLSSLEVENGGIVAVVSEDSDLLAYGCPAIVFKMDRYGNGEEIVLNKIFESSDHVPSFRHFDIELFAGMCVMAGCDFLPSVPGIGIVKAYSLVSKYRNLDRALSVLKFEKGNQMPEDYLKSFREAMAVFQHARIYDADSKSLKHIKPLPEKLLQSLDQDLDFLGPSQGRRPLPYPQKRTVFPLFPLTKPEKKELQASSLLSHEMGWIAMLEEGKYSNEAMKLEKLVSPLSTQSIEESTKITDEISLKAPDNNPFRKRKLAELELDQLENVTEQLSVVTEAEKMEISWVKPESQESVDSKPIKMMMTDGKRRAKSEKLKRDNCLNSENKKSSILNFFCRV
ncbi:5'-3' exonuclease family protein [Actinidia rufa]|uniref:Exonuclease 1 n=1 Tax=Actinidia rufa TaxID=165716 RepID=A0A7J0DCH2_9ERIC|nr:5'-3' exonuclease family protein [Actinidia rufa]